MSNALLPTILIVDDSETTRAMIKRVLAMLAAPIGPIFEAADGAEGLAVLQMTHVDLVLMDLNMPKMDGFEMIAQMRQAPALQAVPVLVISAQPDPEKVALLERQGVAGYLAKPFTAESARKMIEPLLASRVEPSPAHAAGPGESFNMTLAEALATALETTAFISPQFVEGAEPPALPSDSRLICVDFKGKDTQGSLALAASPSLGRAIAANLGLDSDSSADDALKELTNMTCGLLLRMRPGAGVGFVLTPPRMTTPNQTNPASIFKSRDLIALNAEGHLIAAHVDTDAAFYG